MWPLLVLSRPALADHCFLVRVSNDINISDIFCAADLCLQLSESSCEPVHQKDSTDTDANLYSSLPSFLDNSSDPLLNDFFSLYPVGSWPYFTKDFLKLINRHWLTFPPPGRNAHFIFMGVYILLAFFGFSGNAMVIFMISRCKSLRTPSNLLVLNLAISDFILISKIPIFIYNSYKEGPALGSIGCQIYGFIGGMTGTCSIMTLAAIALDRYYVIAYPLNRDYHITKLRAIIWIVIIWLYSATFSAAPLLGIKIKPYVPEGFLTSCSFDYLDYSTTNRIFIFSFFIAAWLIPFIVIVLSYIGICRAVLVVSFATRKGQEKEKRKKELKLSVIVIVVISLWFVAWTPYAIVALLGIAGQKELITPLASMVPAIFCKTASCIDPFVYSLSHPKLKNELFRLLCPKRYAMGRAETHKTMWKMERSQSSINKKGIQCSTDNTNQVELIDMEHIGNPIRKRASFSKSTSSEIQSRDSSVQSLEGIAI